VQKMVDHAIALEDREQRTRLATLIVNVMAQLNPGIRELHDYKQKLWDHLHIISGFRLDVDGPFPPPSPEILERRPERLPYRSNGIRYRHYGKNIENLIATVIEMEEGAKKDELIVMLANQLKKLYLNWNRESVTDEVIAAHLWDLSDGNLMLPEGVELTRSTEILQKLAQPANGTRQKKQNARQGSQKSQGFGSSSGSYYRNKKSKKM
jgi:hypothetical protein